MKAVVFLGDRGDAIHDRVRILPDAPKRPSSPMQHRYFFT